jgi:hypothetical protein
LKLSHVHAPVSGPVFICRAHITPNAVWVSSLILPVEASRRLSTSAFVTDSIARDSLVFGMPRV